LAFVVAVPVSVFFVVLVYFVLKQRYPQASNSIVILIFFTVFDFVTDVLFANDQITRKGLADPIAICSVVFFVAPAVMNVLTACTFFYREVSANPDMGLWLYNHYPIAAIASILAAGNLDCLTLMNSELLYEDMFRAPFNYQANIMFRVMGILGHLLEDVPQLTIQAIASQSELNTIIVLSLLGSSMTIAFGISKRLLLALAVKRGHNMHTVTASASFSKSSDMKSIERKSAEVPEVKV